MDAKRTDEQKQAHGHAEPPETVVALSAITRDASLQVRTKLDERTVKSYANAMEAGAEFPPVRLADVGGTLYLVDGWHRYEAATVAGRWEIPATIHKMDQREARREAALANLTHGLTLKKSEIRAAFRQFIKGAGHRDAKGRLTSYRDIALAMHGAVSYNTIRNWMEKDFPKIYRQMGEEKQGNLRAEMPRLDVEREHHRQIMTAITDARNLARCLQSPESRYEVMAALKEMMSELEATEMSPPDF